MPDPEAIPLTVAQAIASSAQASLEEGRASRKEAREDGKARDAKLEALEKSIQEVLRRFDQLETSIKPATDVISIYLKRILDEHAETLAESADARIRRNTAITSALVSKPAIAALGAMGTALAGVLAHYFGAI